MPKASSIHPRIEALAFRSRQAARREFGEGFRPVRDGVLGVRLHLAEGLALAIRYEYGVVAEAVHPSSRKGEVSVHLALEDLDLAVGRREAEHAGEIRARSRATRRTL